MMVLQESARKRVSEFLQGHIQSKLLSLQQRLDICQGVVGPEPEKALQLLQGIKTDLYSIREFDIRQASHDLYPSIVKLGLVPSLRSPVDRFRPSLCVDLSVDDSIASQEMGNRKLFPEGFRVGVYRIVEEAVDNVVKHAQAQSAIVSLADQSPGNLSVAVTDDGRGFSMDQVNSFVGLVAMREYAEALGGTCRVSSSLDAGTRVQVTLPRPLGIEAGARQVSWSP